MCREIVIDGILIETIGQLTAAIGRAPVFCDDSPPGQTDSHCLCHVDSNATAAAVGRSVSWDDDWSCEEWVKKEG